jgi:hypothetical protein
MLRLFSVIISLLIISTTAIAEHPNRRGHLISHETGGQKESSGQKSSITGRVICEDGYIPLNVQITLSPASYSRGLAQQTGVDESGRFQLDKLSPGVYYVNAYSPGYVLTGSQPQQRYYRPGDDITFRLKKGGVITGTVTDASGEPVVGVQVRLIRVRKVESRYLGSVEGYGGTQTDDRGVYRIYGVPTGSYLVLATPLFKSPSSEIDVIAPTYHPSSTRDTAAEVNVETGQEVSNIDIRYRNERGYSISGILTGLIAQATGPGRISIQLVQSNTNTIESSLFLFGGNNQTFELHGIPDGEYELLARSMGANEDTASPPVRILVKGADVTGVEVKLALLGSLAGRVILERAPQRDQLSDCKDNRTTSVSESLINTLSDLAKKEKRPLLFSPPFVAPDEKGEFKIKAIFQGRYRFHVSLPVESWYVRSITRPAMGGQTISISPTGIIIKQSEKVADITITVSEGGASLRGKVVNSIEEASLPSRLRLHLIPAEREAAEDILRYSETVMRNDATFVMTNIAPGKYWIVARPITEDESGAEISRPAAWEAEARKKLRLEGEATGVTIDLKSCQHTGDYLLRYAQPAAAKPAKKSQ